MIQLGLLRRRYALRFALLRLSSINFPRIAAILLTVSAPIWIVVVS